MMSLSYFNESHIDLKAEGIFSDGSFIDHYPATKASETIGLYSLDTFYVEVTFNRINNEVVEINGIAIDVALKRYLKSKK